MKLLIITQHGDERLGQRLFRHLQRPEHGGRYAHVDFLCGNPKAYRANTRCIETDLNRSYAAAIPQSYEEKRAVKVLQKITHGGYDYVLDIHTSRSECDKLLIVANLDSAVQQIIAATSIRRVVVMPPHIAKGSLIGNVKNAVSFEYDRAIANSQQTLTELVELVDNLLQTSRKPAIEREVFHVNDTIAPDLPIDKTAKNFQKCNLGFYPVLFRYTGGSYKNYRGFRAESKETLVL